MSCKSLYDNELMKHHYHPSISFYYFKQWNDYQMLFHFHPAIEIMYVISGQCLIELEDQLLTLKKGQFIMIDSNVPHRLLVEKGQPCRMLNVEFLFVEKTGAFPSLKELAFENDSLRVFLQAKKTSILLEDPNEVYQTLKSLVLELDEKKDDNKLMISLLISQLLIRVANLANAKESSDDKRNNPYVKKTIDFMHHNYDCDIQVKDIAQAVHLHPSYLHRLFKANMECSIMEYLAAHRVEKAKELLVKSEIPITEISNYIGINSRQYFSTLFKKHTEMTPIEFRNSFERSIDGFDFSS